MEERLTSQKHIISDYLKKVKTHPSAETVYLAAKRKLPRISRGTVYRILNHLKEKGQVQTVPVKGVMYFDGDTSSHAHFICRECHRVFDVFDICSNCNILKHKKLKVGKIKSYQIYFYGYCKNCSRKQNFLPRL